MGKNKKHIGYISIAGKLHKVLVDEKEPSVEETEIREGDID